jgi:NOL1/NOP2/fmu family ribosome biogenesis protein
MLQVSDRQRIIEYFRERFGIPEDDFKGYLFFESNKGIWMVSSGFPDREYLQLTTLKRFDFLGIRVLRKINNNRFKPTTYGLQIIGRNATRNFIELDRDELIKLLRNGHIEKEYPSVEDGYVILRYNKRVLGCGLYKKGILEHQFPKGRTEAMASSGLL